MLVRSRKIFARLKYNLTETTDLSSKMEERHKGTLLRYTEEYEKMKLSISLAFNEPTVKEYAETLTVEALLYKSVDSFVGSYTSPKNPEFTNYLLKLALEKCVTEEERNEVSYYITYFLRMSAFEKGESTILDETNNIFMSLAEKGHLQSSYLVAKQIDMVINSEKRPDSEIEALSQEALQYYVNSISERQNGGLFYIGEMMRKGQLRNLNNEDSTEFYEYGAAFGDPLAMYRMAYLYQLRGSNKLFFKYLKLAAEAGVLEAQHDLGCVYLQGIIVPKDEIKAFSWFMHASAFGFFYSKFNAILLFLKGSSCGKIKPNVDVVIKMLHEMQKTSEGYKQEFDAFCELPEIKELIEKEAEECLKEEIDEKKNIKKKKINRFI